MDHSILLCLAFLTSNSVAKKCMGPRSKNEFSSIASNDLPQEEYVCPRDRDPPTHVECCLDRMCCPSTDQNADILKIIAMAVIITCFLVVIILFINCFWRRGICYECCRPKITQHEVALETLSPEDDPMRLMPREGRGRREYIVGEVKVRMLEDD